MNILKKIFGKEGSTPIVIQCDERESLIWKWRPTNRTTNNGIKIPKDAIIHVNNGEVAVIIGNHSFGDAFKYVEGPYHNSLANIYEGDITSIFFIITQGNNHIKFIIPFFDMADPRNVDLQVPVAVRGSVTFNIYDYKLFVKLNRLADFSNETFAKQTNDALVSNVKSVVASIPIQHNIPLVSLELKIKEVNEIVQAELAEFFIQNYGVNLTSMNISAITIDKESKAFATLKSITQDISVQETKHKADLNLKLEDAKTDVQIKDMREDQVESMRIRREESNIDLMDKRQSVEEKHRVQLEESNIELMEKRLNVEERHRVQKAESDLDILDKKQSIEEKHRIQREQSDLDISDKKQSIEEKHRIQREQTDLDILDKKKNIEEKYRAQREEAELKIKSQESIIEENQFALHAQTEESVRSGRIGSGIGLSGINLNNSQVQMVENLKRSVSPNGLTGSRKLSSTGVTPPKVEKKDDASYHIAIDNNQSGPYTIDQLSQMIKQGTLTSETLIWKKGMPRWVKAELVPELSAILGPSTSEETPPPLP